MKEEILKWYVEKRFEPNKVIQVGVTRHGLTKAQIEASMEHCWDKIVNQGKNIPHLEIARYVFNVAKDIDSKKYEEANDLLLNFEKKWADRERKIALMLYPSWILLAASFVVIYLYASGRLTWVIS